MEFVPFLAGPLPWGRAGAAAPHVGPPPRVHLESSLLRKFWKGGFSPPPTLRHACICTVSFLRGTADLSVLWEARFPAPSFWTNAFLRPGRSDVLCVLFCFCFVPRPVDRSSILTGKFPVLTPKMASLKNSRTDPLISVPREAAAGDTFSQPAAHPPSRFNPSSETHAVHVHFLAFTPSLVLIRKGLPY